MTYSYYPGCTLKNKAKALDYYARKSALVFDIELEEIKDWQCCGGVYKDAKDEIATKLPSVRAIWNAALKNQTLITVCAACHNVIKRTQYDLNNKAFATTACSYEEVGEAKTTKVMHYLEMLRDDVGFDKLKNSVIKNLNGQKIAAYYGCLLLRPSTQMAFDDPENPSILENFLTALGATPVIYSRRNGCCGAYATMIDKQFTAEKSDIIMQSAIDAGAEAMITACPLCKYNLEKCSLPNKIPVYYFTELLGLALDIAREDEI